MAEVFENLPIPYEGENISADDEYQYGWDCPSGFEDLEPPIGRPRKFRTPEEFDLAVNHFILSTEERQEPRTLARLLWSMGISHKALDRYASYDNAFSASVARARTLIQMTYEDAVVRDKNGAAARILGAMNPAYNPAIKVEATDATLSHEERLAHLR